ncbi:hypothetical protein ZEAMMB73_Zm00001d040516 [Zea mays]|jgi:raffinose synthase|uniref:Uncharacterized protein n=1 Tax=Zea mays TaxID=4577 RepID=A0A1D6MR58_MAIZE|nr:hypothetical protein ZEAMMB73_Zm00001d040516 [Zea mays]
MFNVGIGVKECVVTSGVGSRVVALRFHGCSRFGAYCSQEPARCLLDSTKVEFSYDADTGLVSVALPMLEQELYQWTLEIL